MYRIKLTDGQVVARRTMVGALKVFRDTKNARILWHTDSPGEKWRKVWISTWLLKLPHYRDPEGNVFSDHTFRQLVWFFEDVEDFLTKPII